MAARGQGGDAGPVEEPPARTVRTVRGYRDLAAVERAGYTRVAQGLYRRGHQIWELRAAGDGYALVRKREERLVDLRDGDDGAPPTEHRARRTARRAPRSAQLDALGPDGLDGADLALGPDALGFDDDDDLGDDADAGPSDAEVIYDTHEVMHGRHPQFAPHDPVVEAVDDLVQTAPGGLDGPPLLEAVQTDPALAYEAAYGARCGEAGYHCGDVGCVSCRDGAGYAVDARRQRRRRPKSRRVLAVRLGAVAEGVVITVGPDGVVADFGEGPEPLLPELILDHDHDHDPDHDHDRDPFDAVDDLGLIDAPPPLLQPGEALVMRLDDLLGGF